MWIFLAMEPNPFMILGKRRSRAQSQNSCGTNESSQGNEKEKSELKKQKSSDKINKKCKCLFFFIGNINLIS